ncbi:diguanylate cyclase [Candidatus Venteria ishoeyi]|uniref:GGDEF domain-containing response regulator n=1 Tax=Candidatus Venteria ishoeyi TaxID=1899563 RepID=UPI0025A5022F|nr:diguanylate cyclase [Candidatus Venteria ishoeyi]MDM8546214.1 diguanylate cyclase [Candidatus Venteria ishoeyi]
MNVLIAEDNITTRLMLSEWVKSWGYTPVVATDGRHALEIGSIRDAPWLAIIDWMMPEMDGITLCRKLKQQKNCPFIYSIFLTSKNSIEDSIMGLNAGADDFLTKPVRPEELRSRLNAGRRILEYQEQIEERNLHLQALLEAMPGAVILKDAQGCWLEANEYALRMFNLDENTSYHGLNDEILAEQPHAFKQALNTLNINDQKAWEQGGFYREELELPGNAYAEKCWFDIVRTPLFHNDGRRKSMIVLGYEITKRKLLEEKLRREAWYDSLTGVFSRHHFQEHLDKMMSFSRRTGLPMSLCLCDIDSFKQVNDQHGHDVGDQVLAKFAELILHQLRNSDVCGRLGGDEFCIALPGTRAEKAVSCLRRIENQLRAQFFHSYEGIAFQICGSFGVVEFNNSKLTQRELMRHADQALYRAKKNQNNKILIYR